MERIEKDLPGLSLVFDLGWDRVLFPAAIFAALMGGAFIGSLF